MLPRNMQGFLHLFLFLPIRNGPPSNYAIKDMIYDLHSNFFFETKFLEYPIYSSTPANVTVLPAPACHWFCIRLAALPDPCVPCSIKHSRADLYYGARLSAFDDPPFCRQVRPLESEASSWLGQAPSYRTVHAPSSVLGFAREHVSNRILGLSLVCTSWTPLTTTTTYYQANGWPAPPPDHAYSLQQSLIICYFSA
jgi:hypothetical protein